MLGILNVTPDSFSDGGRFVSVESALRHAERMVAEGADGIDIGGESTRPQAPTPVTEEDEIRRIVPVVAAVRDAFADLPISVDTTKASVASAALAAGADIINDVSAFRLDPSMGEIAASNDAGVVLMHSRGGVTEMGTYQYAQYGRDVVGDVVAELRSAVAAAKTAGIPDASIVLDPGIGFAKRSEHSLEVLHSLGRLVALGYPVLVGVSRKRFVGELSGVTNAAERVAGTVGANVVALLGGARLFRVHDVAPNRQALAVAWGIIQAGTDVAGPTATPPDRAPGFRLPVPDSQ
ncbi:MAG TPA: dihydropteroate synthase [Gemmatimonadaceae bacterium]|nr:dihydropteroate synthase [Gemmatimonadaceae bacterium]